MSLRELLGWWPQWCAGRMAYQKERAWKVCTTTPPTTPHTLLTLSMHLFCSIVPKLLLLLFSHSVMSDLLWPHGLQHSRLPCPTPSPGVCSNSCPLSRWCHPTISPSVVLFSSCLQYFLASESFPMSRLFTSGGQRIGTTASASVLPMNIQD